VVYLFICRRAFEGRLARTRGNIRSSHYVSATFAFAFLPILFIDLFTKVSNSALLWSRALPFCPLSRIGNRRFRLLFHSFIKHLQSSFHFFGFFIQNLGFSGPRIRKAKVSYKERKDENNELVHTCNQAGPAVVLVHQIQTFSLLRNNAIKFAELNIYGIYIPTISFHTKLLQRSDETTRARDSFFFFFFFEKVPIFNF
jgi:hypothetical protein